MVGFLLDGCPCLRSILSALDPDMYRRAWKRSTAQAERINRDRCRRQLPSNPGLTPLSLSLIDTDLCPILDSYGKSASRMYI